MTLAPVAVTEIAGSGSSIQIGHQQITGLILAGGRGSRMGGVDKGLVIVGGRAMVERVIARLLPQVGDLIVSANRNHCHYRAFGHRIVPDEIENFAGPLAGIVSGLRAASTDYVITVPCDAPLVSDVLVMRLTRAMIDQNTDLAVAHDGERTQRAFLLLKKDLITDLATFLAAEGRRVKDWLARHRVAVADFADSAGSFANVNDPAERDRIERRLGRPSAC